MLRGNEAVTAFVYRAMIRHITPRNPLAARQDAAYKIEIRIIQGMGTVLFFGVGLMGFGLRRLGEDWWPPAKQPEQESD